MHAAWYELQYSLNYRVITPLVYILELLGQVTMYCLLTFLAYWLRPAGGTSHLALSLQTP